MTLDISDLFIPAPSGVNPTGPTAVPPAGSWLDTLLQQGVTLGLPTTQWNPGGITRTILAMLATGLATDDQIVSTMAQGGFLDWASAVTPDPAVVPAATWAPGWLDELASSTFNCPRELAFAAPGQIVFVNSTGGSLGPYPAGTFHVSNPTTGATYHNAASLTIPTGTSTPQNFVADVAGSGGTSGATTITNLVTTIVGVTCSNPVAFVGANAESNAALVARCKLKQGSLSPNGPEAAYEYFALTALTVLQAINPAITFTDGPITRAIALTDTTTGTVSLIIANATGSLDGHTRAPVLGATNASPIVLKVGPGDFTGVLSVGDWLFVAGVEGNGAANGFHQIAAKSTSGGNTFITYEAASAGSGAYTAGGSAELGDLGLVDYVVQSNCVPLANSETTQWAGTTAVNVAVTVYVPAAHAVDVVATIQTALASYFANVPIGGFTTGVPTPNTVPISGAQAACALAAPYLTDVAVTFNGVSTDVAIPATNIATINGTVAVTVIAT